MNGHSRGVPATILGPSSPHPLLLLPRRLGADLCAADASDGPAGCQLAAAGPAGGWCTGFRSLVLPSLSSAGGEPPDPYILAVLPLAASATRSATQSSTVRAELSLTATPARAAFVTL